MTEADYKKAKENFYLITDPQMREAVAQAIAEYEAEREAKMKVIIVNVSLKKEGNSNGRDWKIYEIETNGGKKYDTFESFNIGEEADIEVTPNDNPKYNAKAKRVKLNKTESKQDARIEKFMNRKEENIAWAGAKRDGVAITVALINAGFIKEKEQIKPTIEHYTKYLYSFVATDEDKQVKDLSGAGVRV